MKRYLRAVSLAALSGVISSPALAASVEALVQAGKHSQAYQQGLKELEAREGDPGFDMAFGTAALRSGNPGDALFAFDRVLVLDPNNVDARLGLAEALVAMKNDKQAMAELTVAGKSRLTPAQQDRLNRLKTAGQTEQQEARDSYSAWVGFDMGHDSNVNAGTYHSNYKTFALGDTSKEQSAYFHQTSVGGSVVRKLSDDRALIAVGQIAQREAMGEEDFDTRNYRLNGGYSVNHKGDVYRIMLRLEQDDLDSDRFRTIWGILGQHTFSGRQAWNRGWLQTLTTGMARIDYQQNETSFRDVDQFLLGMVGEKEVQDFKHTLRGHFIYESAEDELRTGKPAHHNGRRILAAGWRGEYLNLASLGPTFNQFAPGLTPYLVNITPYADVGISRIRHNGALFAAGKHRKQSVYDMKFGLNWKWDSRMTFRAQYQNRWTDANIKVYDHERQVFELGVRYDLL